MDSSSSDTAHNADENTLDKSTEKTAEESALEANEPLNEFDQADADIAANFKDGQLLRFMRVRFPGNNKSFAFYVADKDYSLGQKVLAMSDRGIAVGFVNSSAYEVKFHRGLLPIRRIIKVASAEDLRFDADTFNQEKRLREVCDRLIDRNQLDMALTHVEISQMGKKAIFSFTAPTRVDFRGLVHELVSELKMRIELRQISVRDRAAAVGGLGPCGRELCCSSFLAKYGNVGIKLAKNQDLSLNSSKINGVCGQLKCCLTYEDEVYQEKRRKLPRDNALVKTKDGNAGKVIRLHVLIEQFETISPDGVIRRYVSDMWDGIAEGLEIPKYFENGVTDNSKTIIGLDQVAAKKSLEHEQHLKEAKLRAKSYADSIFEDLFGAKTLDWALPEVEEPQSAGARRVLTPDEEEEIVYVAPEEELMDDEDDESEGELDDDTEDSDGVEETVASAPRTEARPAHPAPQQRPQNHQRIQERPRSPGPSQAAGPRNEGQRNDGPRPPRADGQGGGGGSRRRRGGRGGRGGGGGGQGGAPGGGPRPPRT
ncbi:MAG: stage 0 sporulation family protein [Bacteriovoracia bacterium]